MKGQWVEGRVTQIDAIGEKVEGVVEYTVTIEVDGFDYFPVYFFPGNLHPKWNYIVRKKKK